MKLLLFHHPSFRRPSTAIMFRKPKKGKTSSFRKLKKRSIDEDQDDDENRSQEEGQNKTKAKRFRRRSSSSSDEDDNDSSNGNKDDTRIFLTQYKIETASNIKKGRPKQSGEENMTKSDNKKSSIMQEFKSTEQPMTQKELATLQAEHHPSSNDQSHQETENKPSQRNKFLAGPIRASKFIRTTTRFDYEPNICKDYKDTGFCGFGDTCIYLHDRSNMKSGHVLEQEWEERKRKEREEKESQMDLFCKVIGNEDGESSTNTSNIAVEDDGLPFACYICREAFKEPIVTICSHYFCQACILRRVQNQYDPSCPICNKDTNGVFNHPAKLENKRKKLVGRKGTWEQYKQLLKQT